jgi:hypothetical protein
MHKRTSTRWRGRSLCVAVVRVATHSVRLKDRPMGRIGRAMFRGLSIVLINCPAEHRLNGLDDFSG